jgi:hypothetical protein
MEHISIGIIKLLQDGADKGYWTVDQIDRPSPGWTAGTKVDRRFFKNGYNGVKHRNLLRESGYAPEPEPGVELDGVTIITNASEPNDLPF